MPPPNPHSSPRHTPPPSSSSSSSSAGFGARRFSQTRSKSRLSPYVVINSDSSTGSHKETPAQRDAYEQSIQYATCDFGLSTQTEHSGRATIAAPLAASGVAVTNLYGGPMDSLHPSELNWARENGYGYAKEPIDETYVLRTNELYRTRVTEALAEAFSKLRPHHGRLLGAAGEGAHDTTRALASLLTRAAICTTARPNHFTLDVGVRWPSDSRFRVTVTLTSETGHRCCLQDFARFIYEIAKVANDGFKLDHVVDLRIAFPQTDSFPGVTVTEFSLTLLLPTPKNSLIECLDKAWYLPSPESDRIIPSLRHLYALRHAARNVASFLNANHRSVLYPEAEAMPVVQRGSPGKGHGLAFDCLISNVHSFDSSALMAIEKILKVNGFENYLIETHVLPARILGGADTPGLLLHCPVADRSAFV